ncbi:hypothetical protein ACGF7U_12255 [Micromonospora sp. NPDC047670]|uniref:hypothetical protein n=1 Tax=Micromonospora sp. NPDC047670 TaxID=3364252 RepID=UPI0037232B34
MVAQVVADLQVRPGSHPRTADEIGRALADRSEADLIAISGSDTARPGGVTAVLRIAGRGTDGSWLEPEWVVEDFCFELRFAPTAPTSPRSVPCPSPAARLDFPPPARPRVPSPDELRAALSATAADEAGVRAALARLSVDATVRVDVATGSGAVGVALRFPLEESGRYGCVLARIRTGRVEAWHPADVQTQPGELACLAAESLVGSGMRPPA